MRGLFSTSVLVAVFTTFAFACSAPTSNATTSDGEGLSVVEVRVEPAGNGPVHVQASARFVSVDDPQNRGRALELLGLGWPDVTEGSCQANSDGLQLPQAPDGIHVDLRDRSPVGLRFHMDDGRSSDMTLEARSFPDVVGMVSGVVFVAPKGAQLDGPPRGMALEVQGSEPEQLDLPEIPEIHLDGTQPQDVTVDDTWTVSSAGFGLRSSPTTHPDDRVIIELVRGGALRARCGLDRTGRLWIPAAAIGGRGELSLLVRAQRRSLRAQGDLDARLERDVSLRLLAQ